MALLDELRECGSLIVFTVGRDHTRFARRDDFEPLHEIGLPCMCTESAGRLELRLHRNILEILTTFSPSTSRRPSEPWP